MIDGTDRLLQNMRREARSASQRPMQPDWVCQACSENLTWHRRQRQELLLTIGQEAVIDFDLVHK